MTQVRSVPWNAPAPMAVTVSGMVTLLRGAPAKAFAPMAVTVLPSISDGMSREVETPL